jgi:transposase
MAAGLTPSSIELHLEHLEIAPDHLTVVATTKRRVASCPSCGQPSARVHSRYQRHLADLPWLGTPVSIELHTRRFYCATPGCKHRIFTERLPETTSRYSRRTCRLGSALQLIAHALGGKPGGRLARELGMAVSADTLLRQLLALWNASSPSVPVPRVLGLDDWAWRKGERYGTLLCDLERGRIVDLLPECTAESVVQWLQAHPGVEIISRDRAGLYADGARRGAPEAIQVADRWHLLKNLTDVLAGILDHQPGLLRQAAVPQAPLPSEPPPAAEAAPPISASRERRLARYTEMVELRAQGLTHQGIAQRTGVSQKTVSRWLGAGAFPERRPRARRSQRLDPFRDYLRQRWSDGVTEGKQLLAEIRARGYTGGKAMLYACLRELRPPRLQVPRCEAPPAPSVRRCAWLLARAEEERKPEEQAYLERLLGLSQELKRLESLSREFVRILREHDAASFDPWLEGAAESPLRSFVWGLRRDEDAVRAAITQPWSNGPTEGHVNRLKTVKRAMYGRAGFALLRARLLAG